MRPGASNPCGIQKCGTVMHFQGNSKDFDQIFDPSWSTMVGMSSLLGHDSGPFPVDSSSMLQSLHSLLRMIESNHRTMLQHILALI